MKILIAMDSFKGSLTAPQACSAVKRGFSVIPNAECCCVPMADGGEGTVECLVSACNGSLVWESVPDLFGREKECAYGVLDGGTVVLETAMAAGIAGLARSELDVLRASTYGVGVQIRNAISRGCRRIVLGLGGSATNDGGLGALQALGVSFYTSSGEEIAPGSGGGALSRIVRADASRAVSLRDTEIFYACDVTNPFFGPNGAAYVYAPQKGADAETVALLDDGLRRFASVLAQTFGTDCSELPGAGAAGGLCGGLLCALGGTVRSGYELLSEHAGLETLISSCDLVITGEGKTDGQTAFGKLPCRVGETAKRHGIPAILISGSVDPSASSLYERGLVALFDTVPSPASLESVMANAEKSLEFTAKNVANVIKTML